MTSSTPWPKDVFKRPLQVGDYIAAGMNLDYSSVLRIGEVVSIKELMDPYSKEPTGGFSIRVRWRNNGNQSEHRYGEVKDSNFKYKGNYTYAKFVILDRAFVDQFPADINHEEVVGEEIAERGIRESTDYANGHTYDRT